MAKHVTDVDFETEVLKSNVPVMVDFYADWCGPCVALAPIVEELASDYEGKVKIFKMNVDENQKSQDYGVMSIPTMIFFKGGEAVDRVTGVFPKDSISERLDALLR